MTDRRPRQSPHVALFFTRRTSLRTWRDVGMLDRELAVYRRLLDFGARVTLVTHGDRREAEIARGLPEFDVLFNRWGLPRRIYEQLLPRLHGSALRAVSVIKTNQINGAPLAVQSARRWKKPLIARCGYMWSDFEIRQHGGKSRAAAEALRTEAAVFPRADRCVVTTAEMVADLRRRFPTISDRVRLIPNYVDTDQFAPAETRPDYDLVFVGRLDAEQKNVPALLDAVAPLGLRLLMIGGGDRRSYWTAVHGGSRTHVAWAGRVPHAELPDYLRRARVFVMPSLYEGHPKALLEAMACGRPVIGCDVDGMRGLIRHQTNGYLCGTDAASLRAAVGCVLGNAPLRQEMGRAARKFAVENFGLDRVAELEYSLIEEVTTREKDACLQAA